MKETSDKEKPSEKPPAFPTYTKGNNLASLGSILFEIMPNTGHHYQFIDFDDDLIQKLSPQSIENAKKLKRVGETDTAGWKQHPKKKWIRFKPGIKQYFNPFKIKQGIWVAIESNLGPITRGTTIIPQEPCDQFPFAGQPETPYAYETTNQVPSQSEEVLVSLDVGGFISSEASKSLSVDVRIQWVESLSSKTIRST